MAEQQIPEMQDFGEPGARTPGFYRWAAWFAEKCHSSGALPHVRNPAQAFTILCKGDELGLKAFASWSWIYLTSQGRLAIQSKGALAVAQGSPMFGGYREWIEFEGTPDMVGCAEAIRRGFPPTVKKFSMADADKAGLLKQRRNQRGETYDSTYQSYLKDMLLSRARARALDIAFAAELGGIPVDAAAEDAEMMDERRSGRQQPALPSGPAPVDPVLQGLKSGKSLLLEPGGAQELELQKQIERDVEEVFAEHPIRTFIRSVDNATPAGVKPEPGSQVQPPGELPTPMAPRKKLDRGGGGQCERCSHKTNELGGCDLCGWPGADLR